MKNAKFPFVFALFVAVVAVFAPSSSKLVLFGDPMYDGVFGENLGSLPVVRAGRVMPVSSAAGDILKSLGGKNSAKVDGKKVSPAKWLWTVNADPKKHAGEKFFRTDNRDLQKLLNADGRYYSYNDFAEKYRTLYSAAAGDSPYSRACNSAIDAGLEYAAATNTFGAKIDGVPTATEMLKLWRKAVADAAGEFKKAQEENRPPDRKKLVAANEYLKHFRAELGFENPDTVVRTIPASGGFESATAAMLDRSLPESGAKVLSYYATIRDAVASDDRQKVSEILPQLSAELANSPLVNSFRVRFENFANIFEPFFGGFILYALSLLCAALGAVWKGRARAFSAMATVFLTFAVAEHAFGICARMYIQMRPPVTNLYSSVVFAGGVSALVGLWGRLRGGAAAFAVAAATAGFLSLLVAMNLPYSGDSMGMMRAVLNSNFWLTTHVVTIMVGYCGVFLGGFLAAYRLVANLFSRENFGMETADAAKGIYAVLCFSLLFSFAGTMLGGIWADMSWGRFWGWDPKENGALMVVLWTAATIHAKVLRLCSDRIFLAMAVFGNIVAAWAWFGVNLMGVGLHAYGFMEGGWTWFFAFVLSQAVLLPLALYKYDEKKGADSQKKLEKNSE